MLSLQKSICFGVSALSVNGLIVRILGYKGEQLYNCLQMIAGLFSYKEPENILSYNTAEN